MQFTAKLLPRFNQRRKFNRVPCHSLEFVLESDGRVLITGEKHLVNRPIVACEVSDKALDRFIGEATGLQQAVDVEEVARVLAVQGSNQLASVQLSRRQHRGFDLGGEEAAARRCEDQALDG